MPTGPLSNNDDDIILPPLPEPGSVTRMPGVDEPMISDGSGNLHPISNDMLYEQIARYQRRRQVDPTYRVEMYQPRTWTENVASPGITSVISDELYMDEAPSDMPDPHFRLVENDEHYMRLSVAANDLERRYRGNIPSIEGMGRREADYIDMLRTQKRGSMKAHEFASSEIPQLIPNAPRGMLKEIHLGRLCPDLFVVRGDYHFVCHSCALDTPKDYAYFCNGHIWCSEHVPNLDICALCHELQPNCKPMVNRHDDELHICEGCSFNLHSGVVSCRHCSHNLPTDGEEWVGTGRCPYCYRVDRRGRGDGTWRAFSRELKWVGKDKGAIVKSARTFSCEIEALTGQEEGIRRLSSSLPAECGLSADGSVHSENYEYGFEIQTPRLAGKKGEENIRRTIAALHTVDALVNSTCGLHIHLDGKGIMLPHRREYPLAFLQLWKTHLIFEDVMLSFLPYQRRSNDFCRLMGGSFKITEVDMCESIFDIEKLWYKVTTHRDIRQNKQHHYHSSRYFGVNFHSLLANGHLEIRYHSGTTNGRKILEWANLHCLIMDACAAKKMPFDFFKEAQATTNLRQKTDLLLEKIGMSDSSKQYFYRRQKKFADKENDEEVLA